MASSFATVLPVTLDVAEAQDYYNILCQDFQHLKWKMPEYGFRDTNNRIVPSMTGWAILTPRNINEPHCMLYDTDLQGRNLAKETPCAFGFAKKILELFPTAFRMYITVNSPGVEVEPHIDNENIPRRIYKIIIPVLSNTNAVWSFDDGDIHLAPGNVYLIDTLNKHGTTNQGNTDRVHIMFEIFKEDLEMIKNISVCI